MCVRYSCPVCSRVVKNLIYEFFLTIILFLSFSSCHRTGSIVVPAPLQLEQHMGSPPATRHLPTDLQRPRSSRWRHSVLPSTQQCWHRTARHQHLQPLCRPGLTHRGLCYSCSSVFIQAQATLSSTYKHAAHSQDIFSIVEPNERISGSFWSKHVNIKVWEDSILDFQSHSVSFSSCSTVWGESWNHGPNKYPTQQVIGYVLKLISLCAFSCHASSVGPFESSKAKRFSFNVKS